MAMVKAEAEAEAVVVEEAGTGGEGEVAVLEGAMAVAEVVVVGVKVAVEVDRWVEVAVVEAPFVGGPVDVAGATSVSGRRAFGRFTILGSKKKGTGWSPGSRLPPTTTPSFLFVRFSNLTQIHILIILFQRPWMGDDRPTRRGASQLFYRPFTQEAHLRLHGQDSTRPWAAHQETDLPTPGTAPKDCPPRALHRSR